MALPQVAPVVSEPTIKLSDVPEGQTPSTNPNHVRGLVIQMEDTLEPRGRLTNRIREIAIHIPWYGFKTQVRLAQDSGVSSAAISRLIRHQSQPSLKISLQITAALSRRLGKPLDVRDVFTTSGSYLTPSVCHLTGCRSCLPPEAYDENEFLKPEYNGVEAGMWSLGIQTGELA